MFIAILILTTLSIAGSAAFFSVYGLGQIFTGAFWPVVMMGTSLEAGKLVAASYAYRFWGHISKSLKAYLLSAIFVLMVITSVGIFGFLSAAYQKDILPLAEMEAQVQILDQQRDELNQLKREKRDEKQRLIDDKSKEIAALPPNFATKKGEVAARYQTEIDKINDDIAGYEVQIRSLFEEKKELKISRLDQEIKTGPIVFIAEAFNQEVNNATKWLILIIIFAFDPLAVALTVGANVALVERQSHKRRRQDDRINVLEEALETHEKAEPTVVEMNDVLESKDEVTVEQIKEAIEEMSHRELTPIEQAQKQMIEELLKRKMITEKIRNPHADG